MKKIHRFLLSSIPQQQTISITDPTIVHLMKNVLKLAVGEIISIFADNTDDTLCSIISIEKNSIVVKAQSTTPKQVQPKDITACVSIIKRDNFELVVQKLTELGIHTIIPIISERTVKQSLRVDRLQKISDEALEQSGGSRRVTICEPQLLQHALESHRTQSQCYFDIDAVQNVHKADTTSVLYIGPEGGWSDGDKALFTEYAIESYTLGGSILRAETAAIVAAYTLLWH